MSNLSYLRRVGLALLLLGGVSSAWAAATVTGINQVSATRVGRTTYNYTYTINVTNGTSALSNAIATVTSNAAGTTIVQGTVALGTLAASASITSTNTFTLQQDRLVPFDPASLIWTVTGTPVDLVPNVIGLTRAAATAAITGAGLVVGTVTTASSSTVSSGNVISEAPGAGTQVNVGSAVNLVVSTGPAQVAVPNVVGLTQAAATSAISGAGLVLGTVTQQSSASVASGNVISEAPGAGTQVNVGSAVNLVVSTGPAQVAVPNVVGLTQAAATSAISGAGLVLGTVTQQSSASVASGNVISEAPGAGTQVNVGSAVSLVVSTGPAQVAVPNVVGATQASATAAITSAGLIVGTVTSASSSTVPSGDVISETPGASTNVAVGSAVNLTVSTGPALVAVPNVVGETQAAATTAITAAGLVLGSVTTASSSTVPSGDVISEAPLAGASAAPGSAVNLAVSSGPASTNAVLLPGDPSSPAIQATSDLLPTPAQPANISSGTILNEIVLSFDPAATVGQVNSAIQSVNGSIVTMQATAWVMTIQVPLTSSPAALQQVAASLIGLPGIVDAEAAQVAAPKAWPVTATAAPEANLQHLAAIRSVAAFNVANRLSTSKYPCVCVGDACPTVFIQDGFDNQSPPSDFLLRLPNIYAPHSFVTLSQQGVVAPYTDTDKHGNYVALVLGAQYQANFDLYNIMLGADALTDTTNPNDCVNIVPLNDGNLNGDADSMTQLFTSLKAYIDKYPSNSAIVSVSEGFSEDQCKDAKDNDVDCSTQTISEQLSSVYTAYQRGVEATDWQWRVAALSQNGSGNPYWQHMFVAVAAGNEADTLAAIQWPGAGTAIADHWLTLAAAGQSVSTIAANQNLWGPPAPTAPYATLLATPSQVSILQYLESFPPPATRVPPNLASTTLIVGALQPPLPGSAPASGLFPRLDTWLLDQSATTFSDRLSPGDPGIFAVGENVLVTCPPTVTATGAPACAPAPCENATPNPTDPSCNFEDGTSFATPQVAGTAALLWAADARVAASFGTPLTPLYQSSASVTSNLITSTANVGPIGGNAATIDALTALLSLDQGVAVTPTSAPIRTALVDVNGDGQFDANDVQAFVNVYFADPNNPGSIRATPVVINAAPLSTQQPDFSVYDLNGDGFTGVFTRTALDLDPTGSTQRGAPVLGMASVTLTPGTGQVVTFDESQVSDLDVMCFYAYSPGFFATAAGASADSTGATRAQLQCGVQVLATTGVDTPTGFSGPFTSFDTKVSINNSGVVAFNGSDTAGQNGGFTVLAPEQFTQVTGVEPSTRVISGASINDVSPTASAAFQDRVSGSPPTYFVRSWPTDGSGIANATIVGVSVNPNASTTGFCASGLNAGLACSFASQCPIYTNGVQTGDAACSPPPNGGYMSSTSFVDINDNDLVAFSALAGSNFQTSLWAGHDISDLKELAVFSPTATVFLRPQVSNTDDVVYRDDQGNIQTINYDSGNAAAVSVSPTCTQQTQRPGISRDGQFVAFAATCSYAGAAPRAGIWVAQKISGAWVLQGAVAFAGVNYQSGGLENFSVFNLTTRVGVASVLRADQSYSLEVVFGGTASTGPSLAQADGIYKVSATVSPPNPPLPGNLNVIAAPRRIISVGDALNGKTVSQYDLWDPVSKSGVWVGMSLGFTDGSQVVARALAP